jgi:ABC-type amino acid transport substrate-binding protein
MGLCCRYILILLCLTVLLIIGCAVPEKVNQSVETIPPDESILRVGVSVKAPPMIFKHNQQIVGLEADFARELSAYLNRKLVFVELNWKDQIPALENNRIDIIMSGMTITDLRKMRISFAEPYFVSGQMAMIRSADTLKYVTLLQSGRIGYIWRTTGENFIKQYFPGTQKSGFSNSEAGVKALINKNIDVLVHDGPIILFLASKYNSKGVTPVYSVLTEEYLAWGIRRENVQLRQDANDFLEKIKKDGQLDTIIQQWIPLVTRR